MHHLMQLGRLTAVAVALGAGLTTAALAATPAPSVPLIPRADLFGNPQKAGAQVSPDGRWLSWTAPVNGVMNVWVAPVDKPAEARAVTAATDRPIRMYFWSGDSQHLLYVQDQGGDENFRLYGVAMKDGRTRDLTPMDKVRVRLLGTSTRHKGEALIGLNQRDARWHDVFRLDLASGKLTEVIKGDGVAGFVTDDDLNVRMATRPNAGGGVDYFKVSGTAIDDKPLLSTTLEDSETGPIGYTTDGKVLYWTDTRNRDTAAIYAQDVASGRMTLLAEDKRADMGETLRHPVTGEIEAFAVHYLVNEWRFTSATVGADYAWLQSKLGAGEVSITSRTEADDKWVVVIDPVSAPASAHLFDRKARTLTPLFVSRPALQGAPLVPMHPVEIKARDGLTLPSYLSLPKGADDNGDGKPERASPLVLLVHGGPWARNDYGYSGYHQWLANRGYAVLSVNFRASTGFGKRFLNAGNLQWGKAMHTDLLDAVQWAVQQGVTPKDKVAIMGGSYGGYATLAGLAFTPKAFACGVDIVGPSNLETLLASIPPYWEAGRKQFYARMGDPTTPEGLALLKAASPLYKAGDIQRPLLIGQGANDPRVKQAESDQIVQAMQQRKIPVTYVLFPDEGHGFAKPPNNIAFNAVTEAFLSQCLGGRVEPIGETVRQSSAQVVTGAEHVPDLAAKP